ncbi:MAG: chromate efflux transporter [Deltaproteobacteria bacterium]|nr:chromate efflux transporter [Deltaproteobacteria bacterium]
MTEAAPGAPAARAPYSLRDLVAYFLRLGTTGFGGPIALVGYMQRDLVERRGWIALADYKEGLALAQLAPGPLAAQLAIYLGWLDHGVLGATLVAVAFVLPSFLMVLALSAAYVAYGGLAWMQGAFYGIGAAVIAIIGRSAYKLAKSTLADDRLLWAIFVASAGVTAWTESELIWVFVLCGVAALVAQRARATASHVAVVVAPWLLVRARRGRGDRQGRLRNPGTRRLLVARSVEATRRRMVVAMRAGSLRFPAAGLLVLALPHLAAATVYTVAPSGGDFTVIQEALDAAQAGDTVRVHEKPAPYFERLVFPRSGNAVDGFVTLEAAPGERPVLDGMGVAGDQSMILIESRSYVRVVGFEIRNNLGVTDGSGIRILGSGSHLELRDNRIHDMRGQNAMGITVYATDPAPVSDLVIDGNEVYDCEPATSEAIVLNGNVDGFVVSDNHVHDVDNIGIDCIGGETDIQPDPAKVCRNGVIRGNRVERARSSYGGGFAAGIYVDGGRDVVIENNVVTECDVGMEIGAENGGTVTSGIVVRNNVLHANDKAGLGFGGYASYTGRVRDCSFTGNTLYKNDTLGAGFGELWIQYAEDNVVRSNVVYATGQNKLLVSEYGNVHTTLDDNVWWADAGAAAARFSWNAAEYVGFAAYRAGTGQDAGSIFADPLLAAPVSGDFHLGAGSPAIDAGDPGYTPAPGEVDLDGAARKNGPRVDCGADEATTCGNGTTEPPELCDDGDLVDGDGCDSNCTPTGCGNGIATSGEQCDDGGTAGGDCCDAACQHEANGAPCDDANPCTTSDACTTGTCAGGEEPAAGCKTALGGQLQIKDRTLVGAADAGNQLSWQWKKGSATTDAELGDPLASATRYELCIYDQASGSASLAARLRVPGAGTCHGKPCWKAGGAGSFKYADKDATPDGVTQLTLRPGVTGKTRVQLKARGLKLAVPALPLAQSPSVVAQLHASTGACWTQSYGVPAARNDAAQFKDKTP